MTRRRRTVLVLALALAGAVGPAVAFRPRLAGWNEPPGVERTAASRALAAAAEADAPRLAPAAMTGARERLEAASREEARQRDRRVPWTRDYRAARAAYAAAALAADSAAALADGCARTETAEARALVVLADSLVGDTERLARQLPFPRRARTRLRAAALARDEARQLLRKGRERTAAAGAAARRALEEATAARAAALPAAARFADERQVHTWCTWIDETVHWSAQSGRPAIVVYKEKRMLVLYDRGRTAVVFTADLGRNRLNPKRHAGDAATPEGRYHVVARKEGGQTRFYKALLLDYPNADDRARFARSRAAGKVPAGVGPGRNIEIHGRGGRDADWTDGCVALADSDMEALFAQVPVGTPVTIVGGDGRGGTFSSLWRRTRAEGGR